MWVRDWTQVSLSPPGSMHGHAASQLWIQGEHVQQDSAFWEGPAFPLSVSDPCAIYGEPSAGPCPRTVCPWMICGSELSDDGRDHTSPCSLNIFVEDLVDLVRQRPLSCHNPLDPLLKLISICLVVHILRRCIGAH